MLICPVIFGKFPHSFPFYKIKNRFESGIRPPGLEHVFVAYMEGPSFTSSFWCSEEDEEDEEDEEEVDEEEEEASNISSPPPDDDSDILDITPDISFTIF